MRIALIFDIMEGIIDRGWCSYQAPNKLVNKAPAIGVDGKAAIHYTRIMENELRDRWNTLAPWMNKMIGMGTRFDTLITDRFPQFEGRDFGNPDSFTDQEISDIFDWLAEQ